MNNTHRPFTPALGRLGRLGSYDKVVAIMTRERMWRAQMLAELAPKAQQSIVDIGSGTGSFAILVKQASPGARVIGIDPDPNVRRIAEMKAETANVSIKFITAFGEDSSDYVPVNSMDAVTCSLELHQCPIAVKIGILENTYGLLRPAGTLLISDYGMQRTLLMTALFNQVRLLDGYKDTKANKDGRIPELIHSAGFCDIEELKLTQTPTGSISLYRARKPE